MKKVMIPLIPILLLLGAGVIVFKFYEYLFAKTVDGPIVTVERVMQTNTLISSGSRAIPTEQLFSFAVAIKDSVGEIHTASSEDRQWAVAQKGQCAEAKYFPYPPWDLASWGTYHNARLLRLYECPEPIPPPSPTPTPSSAPTPTPKSTPQ